MNNKKWHGIMKVLEIQHTNAAGEILWQSKNLHNILHFDGEEFLLRAAFTGGQISDIIPENYYLGLDNRTTLSDADDITDLVGEPTSGGYQRQAVASSGDFSMNVEDSHFVAVSPIVAFNSLTASWGPVRNLFITDMPDNTGFLISSVSLDSPITLDIGDSVTLRIGMQIKECP